MLDLTLILQEPNPLILCEKLLQFLNELAVPRDISEIAAIASQFTSTNKELAFVVQLFQLELSMYFNDDGDHEGFYKAASTMAKDNSDPVSKLKYQDLSTDYQFFFTDTDFKLMDLLSKKINMVQPGMTNGIVDLVHRKIVVYSLICDSDPRADTVASFLLGIEVPAELTGFLQKPRLSAVRTTRELFQLVSLEYPFHAIIKNHHAKFVRNCMDKVISALPQYYESITYLRLSEVLDGCEDFEDLIFEMIMDNKFPHGAFINQKDQIVTFSDPAPELDPFNRHVQQVCDVVEKLRSQCTKSVYS